MQLVDRDYLFLDIARLFAEHSTCVRGHTGAVIALGGRIISTGYNGAPEGMKHCTEVGCGGGVWEERLRPPEIETFPHGCNVRMRPRERVETFPHGCTRATHAEANAVAYAARHGISTEGATMYCTHSPCVACAHVMAASGLSRVVFSEYYRITEPIEWLKKVMEVTQVG